LQAQSTHGLHVHQQRRRDPLVDEQCPCRAQDVVAPVVFQPAAFGLLIGDEDRRKLEMPVERRSANLDGVDIQAGTTLHQTIHGLLRVRAPAVAPSPWGGC